MEGGPHTVPAVHLADARYPPLKPRGRVLQTAVVVRSDTGLDRTAEDLVLGIVVGSLGVFIHEHGGESFGAAEVFRNRRIGQTEMVEGHVTLPLVVPFTRTRDLLVVVLVVDLSTETAVITAKNVVRVESGGRVPLMQRTCLSAPMA